VDVTGRPPAQEPPPAGTGAPASTIPTTAGDTPGSVPPATFPEQSPGLDTQAGGGGGAEPEPGPSIIDRLLEPLLVLVGLALAYTAVVLALRAAARRRAVQRLLATTGEPGPDGSPGTAQRARLAWHHATERLAVAGLRRRPAETPHEFTGRVRSCTDLDPGALTRLADLEAAATYGGREPEEAAVARAEGAADEVDTWVRTSTSWWERARWALDPRSLVPHRQRIVPAGSLATER
jgi:hypothetical protein